LHVGHLDHQGFGSRIIGFGDSRNQYAEKNTPALQTTTGHFPAARRPARKRKRKATFRGKRAQDGRFSAAVLNSFPCKIIIVKNFTISSRAKAGGRNMSR
jgi:hypothetical protein